jgi:hypothetical protein
LRAEAICGGHAEHDGFPSSRRHDPPTCSRGDNAADREFLGEAEQHRAVVRLGLSRESWLRSVGLPMEFRFRHRSNAACSHV